ncbi:MAG TPA: methyltransferase domain-containing protein [Chloroflexota bacterium]|jgi:spermidine synthase|nr:methyltransferase domain-containing protein [Chloroflexota bacterium]
MGERTRPRVQVAEDEGRRALLVDGVVQSVAVDGPGIPTGYWAQMLPEVRPRRALLLGLGAGTVAHLLVRRFGPVPMIGVEVDAEVLAVARAEFGLALPSLTIVEADARRYVLECSERFDYVCVDLYRGGQLERGALARPFLRGIRRRLLPGSLVVFNLLRDKRLPRRLQRVQQVFPRTEVRGVGKNVVVRCPVH